MEAELEDAAASLEFIDAEELSLTAEFDDALGDLDRQRADIAAEEGGHSAALEALAAARGLAAQAEAAAEADRASNLQQVWHLERWVQGGNPYNHESDERPLPGAAPSDCLFDMYVCCKQGTFELARCFVFVSEGHMIELSKDWCSEALARLTSRLQAQGRGLYAAPHGCCRPQCMRCS